MSVSRSTRFEIFRDDNYTCRYCGRSAPAVVLEVEHVIPRSKGGTDRRDNLVTACFDCNRGKYNRPATPQPAPDKPQVRDKLWTFVYRESGFVHHKPLYLYPEIDGSSVVGDYDMDEMDDDPFGFYCDYLRRHHPDWWAADAAPIGWMVKPVMEFAPFTDSRGESWHKDFLTYMTWPEDQHGNRLDWFSLPVRMDRFPEFAKSIGWKPSPLQSHAPVRALWEARNGY